MHAIISAQDTNAVDSLKGSKAVINSEGRLVNNTKLANVLPFVNIKEGKGAICIDNVIKGRKDIHTRLLLISDETNSEKIHRLNDFDLEILDVITTLINIEGMQFFNAKQVASKVFPDKKLTAKKISSTSQSIEKLMSISIDIRCQEEFEARNDITGDNYGYKGQIIPLSKVSNSGEFKYIVLLLPNGKPFLPIYEYAKSINQIITVPYTWLSTPAEYYQATEEAICIRRRVILRIKQLIYRGIGPKTNRIALFWEDEPNKGLIPALGYKVDREGGTWSGGPLDRENNVIKKNWNRKKVEIQKVIEGTLHHLADIRVIGGYSSYHRPGSKEVIGYVVKKGPMGRKKAS